MKKQLFTKGGEITRRRELLAWERKKPNYQLWLLFVFGKELATAHIPSDPSVSGFAGAFRSHPHKSRPA